MRWQWGKTGTRTPWDRGPGLPLGLRVTVTSQSPTLRTQPCPQQCSGSRHVGLPTFSWTPKTARLAAARLTPLLALGPAVACGGPRAAFPPLPSVHFPVCSSYRSACPGRSAHLKRAQEQEHQPWASHRRVDRQIATGTAWGQTPGTRLAHRLPLPGVPLCWSLSGAWPQPHTLRLGGRGGLRPAQAAWPHCAQRGPALGLALLLTGSPLHRLHRTRPLSPEPAVPLSHPLPFLSPGCCALPCLPHTLQVWVLGSIGAVLGEGPVFAPAPGAWPRHRPSLLGMSRTPHCQTGP